MSAGGGAVAVDVRIKDVPHAEEFLFYAQQRLDRLRERVHGATGYVVRVARAREPGKIDVRVEIAAEAPLAIATASDPDALLALRDAFDVVERRLARSRSGIELRPAAQPGEADAETGVSRSRAGGRASRG